MCDSCQYGSLFRRSYHLLRCVAPSDALVGLPRTLTWYALSRGGDCDEIAETHRICQHCPFVASLCQAREDHCMAVERAGWLACQRRRDLDSLSESCQWSKCQAMNMPWNPEQLPFAPAFRRRNQVHTSRARIHLPPTSWGL